MKFQRLTILASAVILGLGLSSGAYAFSAEMTKSYSQGDKASFLAGAHNQKGISCQMCHTTDKVSDSETEINKQCVMCHEPNALVKKTEKPHQPNPHKSHLGDVQCTACHSGHTPSVAYCTNCHDFPSMKDMKFGKGAKPASQYEDLTKYDNAKPERTETTDILVVGSGAAGFVAAFTAQEAGVKNIIMVEKMAVPGGNSQLAAGGMNAAGTPYQKEKGIEDNAKLMFEDTMKGGKNVSNPELAKILAERSADSIKWLADRGAVLSHVGRGGGASAARMHGPAGGVFVVAGQKHRLYAQGLQPGNRLRAFRTDGIGKSQKTCRSPVRGQIDDGAALFQIFVCLTEQGIRHRTAVFFQHLLIAGQDRLSFDPGGYALSGNHLKGIRLKKF